MLLLGPINVLNDLLLKIGFTAEQIAYFVWPLIQIGLVVTLVALWVAYATYLERKISAFMQARLGPMRVGPWGLLQPIADGLKLLTKEDFIPEKADRWIFFFAPYIAVASAFIVFSVIPFGPDWAVIADVNLEVRAVGWIAFERADGLVRSGDGIVADRRTDVWTHVVAVGNGRGAGIG